MAFLQVPVFPREGAVLGGPKNPKNLRVEPTLPEAFKASFFRKPEDWSDKYLAYRVRTNPIVDLCLRISTYSVGKNNKCCFDPKRLGQKMSSSSRLYQMIGRYVGRPTYKRMLASSSRQWKFVEECWVANMHTVLLNRMFDPTKLDRKLFRAIRRYKLWFLKFFFAGSVKHLRNKAGKLIRKFIPINFERGISALKNIAGCLQWATMSDLSSENATPPKIPYWRGWHSEEGAIELVWFDGHLSRWRSCLRDLKFSDSELTNLCQIRTFGRALPCPTRKMCEEAFREQAEILTSPRPIDSNICAVVKRFSQRLGERLSVWEMPLNSHISVSTSGSFDSSQRNGGLAANISEKVSAIDVSIEDVYVENHPDMEELVPLTHLLDGGYGVSHFCDPYGDCLFPRPASFYRMSRAMSARKKSPQRLLDLLFGESGDTTRHRLVKKFVKGEPLPHSLGRIVLWLSSCEAISQGYFTNESKVRIQPICTLKIGSQSYPVFSRSQMKYHLTYNPVDCPKVKLDCLAEPGAKTRPLGKNQEWFTMVTRTMRFMVEPIVARDGRARIGLRSTNKMWSFLKYVRGISTEFPGRMVCQSTDFKSATDLISLDIIEAIWGGFCSKLPSTHPFWVYYKLITCKRRMFSPRKFQKLSVFQDGTENLCGSFMGEPMSFITLTLLNLLIEEISAHYYLSGAPVWSPTLAPDLVGDPVCICGDDVGALRRDLRRARLFKRVALDMGMLLSWKDGLSRRVLIFCEDHTLIEYTQTGWKPVYVDVIKSRLLTTMARDHSENRSSILGKGRMLSNQLDYFEDKNLKIACLGYFSLIFDRVYNYTVVDKIKLPLYLPPSCGGAGIPTVDSLMPSWMYPYIGYIFRVLDLDDYTEKYSELQSLSALNSRVKHGVSVADKNILRAECARYKLGNADHVKPNVIFDDDFIKTYLEEVCKVEIPLDPYLKKYDFESLRNEASRIGFVQFSSLAEEVERILNFQRFFSENVVKEPRTFNRWVKSSNKYWKRVFVKHSRKDLAEFARERFTTVAALDKAVSRAFSGWIFIGDSDEAFNLVNSGPSLKLRFSQAGALSHERIHGNRQLV